MSESKKFSVAAMKQITDNRECMHLAVEAFNQAMETQDYDTVREVAEFVLGDEVPNADFGAGFQLHCLNWLTHHYRLRYADSADDSPEEETALHGLLSVVWKWKWIVSKLPWDINLSREEMAQANDAMRELYTDLQFSLEAVEKTLTEQSIILGDVDAAREHFVLWQSLESDDGGDCAACERDALVQYHHFIGEYEQVLNLAQPIMAGDLTCSEVPHITYQYVVDALIRLGKHDDAVAILYEAIDLLTTSSEENISLLPPLILAAVQLGKRDWAMDLLDEYNDAILNISANNRLYYLQYLMCCAPFNDEALTAAQEVAAQFDERNGNSFYQDKLALLFQKAVVH